MKKNALLISILILGLIASSITVLERTFVESKNKTVDVVLDYEEIDKLAKQSDHDLIWWFNKYKGLGVNYVVLKEESLESLIKEKKPVNVTMGGNIFKDIDWKKKFPGQLVEFIDQNGINDYDVVAVTSSKELFEFIKKGLETYYDSEKFTFFEGEEKFAIILHGTMQDALFTEEFNVVDSNDKTLELPKQLYSSKLMKLAFGLDPEKIQIIEDSGLKVLPRPYSYKGWTGEKAVHAVIENYEKLNIIPYVFIFDGTEVLGYQKTDEIVKEYMRKNNIKAGLIETPVQRGHIEQSGISQLASDLDYNAIRVFSVWDYFQERFRYYNYEGAEEIENTLYRAVTERNIRLIYFKPFKYDKVSYVTDYKEYEKMFDRFKGRIAEHGMTLGESSTMPFRDIGFIQRTLIGWGVAAAVVLLLSSLIHIDIKKKYILLGIGMLGEIAMLFVLPSWGDKIIALTAAIVFPTLSMVYFCSRCRKYIFGAEKNTSQYKLIGIAAKDLLLASLISLAGALFVGSVLSDMKYLIELDIFRGVKISQLLPILAYMIIYIGYFGYKRATKEKVNTKLQLDDIKRFLFDDIKIFYVILASIMLLVGYVYISRTGHESGVQAISLEIIFRNFLEENLLARPRTKEFLIGFPIMMVGIYSALRNYRKLVFLSGLLAVIGQGSIVNTFSHLRTPVYLSVVRTAYSLLFGIVLGAACIFILEVGIGALKRLQRTNWYITNIKMN